jgi:hypothetical protein
LARIAGIVGEDKIGSLELLDTYRTEGFRMQRFAPNSKDNLKNKSNGKDKDAATVTALRIFRPTVPATVTLHDGSPTHIACPKRKSKDKEIQGKILWAAGPWRSSGDWCRKHGPETNGILPCKQKPKLLYFAWSGIC